MRATHPPRPPRLLARTRAVSFGTVAILLAAVLAVLAVQARSGARASAAERLVLAQQVFRAVEQQRQHDLLALMTALAESPTLKAALDLYDTESKPARAPSAFNSSPPSRPSWRDSRRWSTPTCWRLSTPAT